MIGGRKMGTRIDFNYIENKLGYKYKDKNILLNALTHSSHNNESKSKQIQNNERLEFLGDATLELIISEYLYRNYPDLTEGEMTKMRARIVCSDTLAEAAFKLGIGNLIILGKGEAKSGGRKRKSIMADAMEAIIGSIYLDGGLEEARNFIVTQLKDVIRNVEKKEYNKDYKTLLQEIVQRDHHNNLEYVLTKEEGPDHDKSFYVNVKINDRIYGSGVGKNKKEAEQEAARIAIDLLDGINN